MVRADGGKHGGGAALKGIGVLPTGRCMGVSLPERWIVEAKSAAGICVRGLRHRVLLPLLGGGQHRWLRSGIRTTAYSSFQPDSNLECTAVPRMGPSILSDQLVREASDFAGGGVSRDGGSFSGATCLR